MQEQTLFEQWIVIYQRKWEIFAVTLAAIITSWIMFNVIDPIYEASLTFYPPIQSVSTNYLSADSEKSVTRETLLPMPNEDYLAPFIGLLKSKKIAERVAAEYPEVPVQKLLRSNMDFEVTNEYMMKIYARANDPQSAADIANAYFRNLNDLLNEASLKDYGNDEKMLGVQIKELEGQLAQKTKNLIEFERANGIADLGQNISQLYGLMEQMTQELDQTKAKIKESEARIKALEVEMMNEDEDFKKSLIMVSTPYLEQLRGKHGSLSEQMTIAMLQYGPKNEKLLTLKTQLEDIENKIENEHKNILSSTIKPDNTFVEKLRQDIIVALIEKESLDAKVSGYNAMIEIFRNRLATFPAVKQEWQDRSRAIASLQEETIQLKKNLREMELQRSREPEHFVLIDPAETPNRPAFPILWLNLFIGGVVGCMAGLMYAYLLEYTKRSAFISMRMLAREIVKHGETHEE